MFDKIVKCKTICSIVVINLFHILPTCLGGTNLGIAGGDTLGTVDVPTPCAAWMVPVVQDESTHPSLGYSVEKVEVSFRGRTLIADVPVLTPKRTQGHDAVCIVKVVNGKNFAILKRGLV